MRRIPLLLVLTLVGPLASAAELAVLEAGSAAQLTALGNEALMQGRYETAIEQYRRALTVEPAAFHALFNLALAYQQLGQTDEARRRYEDALKVSHDHPEVLCNLGFLAFRAGDFTQAVERFQEAARQAAGSASDAADYWFNAGTARERLRQWPEARRAYEECLALDQAHFGGHFNLGTLLLGALAEEPQALDKAESHLAKARDLAPTRAEAWVNLALCHERAGRGTPATELDQAVKIAAPAFANQALWQRARFHEREQPPHKTAMRDDLKTILASDPHFPQANGLLGAYHFSLGEYSEAITLLEREVEPGHFDPTAPIDAESHYLLAMIYTEHRPDPAKALQHATDYYQLHPNSAKIHELRRRALRLGTAAGEPMAEHTAAPAAHPAPASDSHASAAEHGAAPAAPTAIPTSGHAPAHAPAPAAEHTH